MSVPAAPTNIVLQTGNGQNFLSWPFVATATSYKVQRSPDGITFSALASGIAAGGYLDTTAVIGTAYFYQVAATNGSGDSGYTASYPLSIVPCAPGQINLGYLRYMSQLRADKLNSQYLTTDEWNFNINQSATELYDILVARYGDDYFFASPLQIPLTGAVSYALPDGVLYSGAPACFKLNGVDGNFAGAWKPLARFNWSDRDKYTIYGGNPASYLGIYDMAYREMGNQLFVIPQNNGMNIQLWYVPLMKQMLQDNDMLLFSMSGWSEYVINDAAMKGMIKEESLEKWNALSAAKGALLDRIKSIATNRDVGQPNSVSNVRATMGDPGFSSWNNGYGGGGFGAGGGYG